MALTADGVACTVTLLSVCTTVKYHQGYINAKGKAGFASYFELLLIETHTLNFLLIRMSMLVNCTDCTAKSLQKDYTGELQETECCIDNCHNFTACLSLKNVTVQEKS